MARLPERPAHSAGGSNSILRVCLRDCLMKIGHALLALGAVTFSGCAELSKFKIDSDGVYRFKSHPIAVWAPSDCLLDIAVHDGQHQVDFVTGQGYWRAGGLYAVQVFATPDSVKDDASFLQETKKFIPSYMAKDRAAMGLEFRVYQEKQMQINQRTAYRAIAVDKGKAAFVATFVLHGPRIIVSSLVYPLENTGDVEAQIPWACYDRFVGSVREVQTSGGK